MRLIGIQLLVIAPFSVFDHIIRFYSSCIAQVGRRTYHDDVNFTSIIVHI
jgi:hypothetical protein